MDEFLSLNREDLHNIHKYFMSINTYETAQERYVRFLEDLVVRLGRRIDV